LIEQGQGIFPKILQTVWKHRFFGGDEVLGSFLRLAIRFVKDLSNAVMLDNALGLSK
jgi:hypothetical protein